MTVITVSRQFNSGGNEIAFRAAQRLGFSLFEQQMYIEAAQEIELGNRLAWLNLSEDRYQIKSFLAWLLSGSFNKQHCLNEDECLEQETQNLVMLKQAVRRARRSGNTIIVGRGAQAILRGQPGVVHVRITAPTETRVWNTIQRIRELYYSDETPDRQHEYDRAWDLVAERDEAYAAFMKHFFKVDENDPKLYDLTIDCQEMNVDQAVEKITRLARRVNEKEIKEVPPVVLSRAGLHLNH